MYYVYVLYGMVAQIYQKPVGPCKILGARRMAEAPQMCIRRHCA